MRLLNELETKLTKEEQIRLRRAEGNLTLWEKLWHWDVTYGISSYVKVSDAIWAAKKLKENSMEERAHKLYYKRLKQYDIFHNWHQYKALAFAESMGDTATSKRIAEQVLEWDTPDKELKPMLRGVEQGDYDSLIKYYDTLIKFIKVLPDDSTMEFEFLEEFFSEQRSKVVARVLETLKNSQNQNQTLAKVTMQIAQAGLNAVAESANDAANLGSGSAANSCLNQGAGCIEHGIISANSGDTYCPKCTMPLWNFKDREGKMLFDGRFEIKRNLGEGGAASVYHAYDHKFRKDCAVKFSRPQEYNKLHFEREARLAHNLDIEGVCGVYDFSVTDQKGYIVMNYVDGKNLETLLEENCGPLDEKIVSEWALSVCKTLEKMHSRNPQVLHRDIKPANIILQNHGENNIILVDLGIAREVGRKTQTKLIAGTPGFAPEEQYKGKEDARSDLYSLGATMHYLLTGKHPAELDRMFYFPPLRSLSPLLSEDVEWIVQKATSAEMKDRFQNAAEMRNAIEDMLQGKPVKPKDKKEFLYGDVNYSESDEVLFERFTNEFKKSIQNEGYVLANAQGERCNPKIENYGGNGHMDIGILKMQEKIQRYLWNTIPLPSRTKPTLYTGCFKLLMHETLKWKKGNFSIYGTENSEEMLFLAKKLSASYGLQIQGTLEQDTPKEELTPSYYWD